LSCNVLSRLTGRFALTPPTLLASRVCILKICFRTGFDSRFHTDVISLEKSGEHFRLLYDVKGRFTIHRITPEEASYKLLKVRKVALGARGVPYIVTHDGRTIRYPDPLIKVNDTVKFDIEQNKITDFVKFDTGNIVMITGGRSMGRAGVIVHREKHIGGFDIVHVKDSLDRTFATR
jgi:small subunit ribosomal protein S4e